MVTATPRAWAIASPRCRGASVVKKYQVYSVAPDGGIVGHQLIRAYCDEEAIAAVRSMQRQLNTEIWYVDRRIGRVPGVPRLSG